MGLNFPDSPTPGTVFGNYTWDGEKWVSTGTGVVSDASKLNLAGGQTTTGGFRFTAYNAGVLTAGQTLTPDAYNGSYQYYTNNGAHTLAAPVNDCAMDIMITNGATAGAITPTGFTIGNAGDVLTATNGSRFIFSIRRINAISTYTVKALQ